MKNNRARIYRISPEAYRGMRDPAKWCREYEEGYKREGLVLNIGFALLFAITALAAYAALKDPNFIELFSFVSTRY